MTDNLEDYEEFQDARQRLLVTFVKWLSTEPDENDVAVEVFALANALRQIAALREP